MRDPGSIDWEARAEELRRQFEQGVARGLYAAVSVHPDDVLARLRRRGLRVADLQAVARLALHDQDREADAAILQARRMAAFSGASLGLAGLPALGPALGHLGLVLVRLAQTLALVYGFDPRGERGQLQLWKALAGALGAGERAESFEGTQADLARNLPAVVGRSTAFVNPLAIRLAQAAAGQLTRTAPAALGRAVPVVGGAVGMVANWRQVGRTGSLLKEHYRTARELANLGSGGTVAAEILRG